MEVPERKKGELRKKKRTGRLCNDHKTLGDHLHPGMK